MRKERDGRAPDGEFSDGLRWVRPGGWVKAAGHWYQHPALVPYVGKVVKVYMADYWYSEVGVHWHVPFPGGSTWICNAPERTAEWKAMKGKVPCSDRGETETKTRSRRKPR